MTDTSHPANRPTRGQACIASLQRGLLLEDRLLLIPWRATFQHITGDCLPDRVVCSPVRSEIYWQNPVLLNGLHAQLLHAVLYDHGWLDAAEAWLERGNDPRLAQARFEHAHQHLVRLLGDPTCTGARCNCEQIKELAAWDWPHLRLALIWRLAEPYEGYTQLCLMHISHR